MPILDEIFKCVIKHNKTIELNTKLLSQPEHYEALLRVYSRFHDLGGKDITVGSDAHHALQYALPQEAIMLFLHQTGLSLMDVKKNRRRRI